MKAFEILSLLVVACLRLGMAENCNGTSIIEDMHQCFQTNGTLTDAAFCSNFDTLLSCLYDSIPSCAAPQRSYWRFAVHDYRYELKSVCDIDVTPPPDCNLTSFLPTLDMCRESPTGAGSSCIISKSNSRCFASKILNCSPSSVVSTHVEMIETLHSEYSDCEIDLGTCGYGKLTLCPKNWPSVTATKTQGMYCSASRDSVSCMENFRSTCSNTTYVTADTINKANVSANAICAKEMAVVSGDCNVTAVNDVIQQCFQFDSPLTDDTYCSNFYQIIQCLLYAITPCPQSESFPWQQAISWYREYLETFCYPGVATFPNCNLTALNHDLDACRQPNFGNGSICSTSTANAYCALWVVMKCSPSSSVVTHVDLLTSLYSAANNCGGITDVTQIITDANTEGTTPMGTEMVTTGNTPMVTKVTSDAQKLKDVKLCIFLLVVGVIALYI